MFPMFGRFKEKKEAVEPEADPERDQRTVFAYQVDGLTSQIFIDQVLQELLACSKLLLFCRGEA